MRLRTIHRLPGRYREDDLPELPPTAKFVTPDVKYDPNLRAAAFPTLPLDQFPPSDIEETRRQRIMPRTSSSDVETNLGGLMGNGNRNGCENGARLAGQRKATVFRDKRVSLPVVRQLIKAPDFKGEYDGYATLDPEGGEKDEERTMLQRRVHWDDMSDGTKLVLMREVCQEMSFQRACEIFALQEDEIAKFMGIYAQELDRNNMEEVNIARAADKQVTLLMSGTYSSVVKDYTKISEELYNSIRTPATFLITAEDVLKAKLFLVNFNFDDDDTFRFGPDNEVLTVIKDDEAWGVQASIINRMGSYEGVQASWYDIDFDVSNQGIHAAREEGENTEEEGDTDEMEDTINVIHSRSAGRPRENPTERDTPHGKPSQSRNRPAEGDEPYGIPLKRSGKRLTLQDEEDIKAGLRRPPRAWKGSLTRPAHLMPKTRIPPGGPGPSRLRQSITASDLDTSSGTASPMTSSSQPPSRPTPRPDHSAMNGHQAALYAPRIFSGGKPYPGPPSRQLYVNTTVFPHLQHPGLRDVETPESRRSRGYGPVRDIGISSETMRMNHLPSPHGGRSVQTLPPARPSNHPPINTSRRQRRSQSPASISSARNSAPQSLSISPQQSGGSTVNMGSVSTQRTLYSPNNTNHAISISVPQKRKVANAPSGSGDNSVSCSPPNQSHPGQPGTASQVPETKRNYIRNGESSSVPSQSPTGSVGGQNALTDTKTFPNVALAQYAPQITSRAGIPGFVPPADCYPLIHTPTPQATSQTENIPNRYLGHFDHSQSPGTASRINELQSYVMSRATASPMSQGVYQHRQNFVDAPPRSIYLGSGQLATQSAQNFANAPPRTMSLGPGQPAAPITTPSFVLSESWRAYLNNIYPQQEGSPKSHQQSHPLQSEDRPAHIGIYNNSIQSRLGVRQQANGGHTTAPQPIQRANGDIGQQGTIFQRLDSPIQTETPIPQYRTSVPQPMVVAPVVSNESLGSPNATANSVHSNKSNESANSVLQPLTPTRQNSRMTEQQFNTVPEIETPVSKHSSRDGKTPSLPPSLSSSPTVIRDTVTLSPVQRLAEGVDTPQPASSSKFAVRLKLSKSKSFVSGSYKAEEIAPELATSPPMSRRSSSIISVASGIADAPMGRRSSSRRSEVSKIAGEPLSALLEQTTLQPMSRRSSSRMIEASKTSDEPMNARSRRSAEGKAGSSQKARVPSTPKGNNAAGASSQIATKGKSANMSKKMGAPPELFEKTRSATKASRNSGGSEFFSSSGEKPKHKATSSKVNPIHMNNASIDESTDVQVVVPDMNPKRRASNQPDAPAPAAKKLRTRATGATAASRSKTVEKKPIAKAAPAAVKTASAKSKEAKVPAMAKTTRLTTGRKK
ncbi:hypothetical protein B7494_g643 [Chlorociboria aeruginascens]|nr:hypothetical protein B7494_g643 [Chlorociboria aeruginascens]